MRTPEQLIDELRAEVRDGGIASLILVIRGEDEPGEDEPGEMTVMNLYLENANPLWELKEAIAVGALPVGVIRVKKSTPTRTQITIRPLAEYSGDSWVTELLRGQGERIKQVSLDKFGNIPGFSIE